MRRESAPIISPADIEFTRHRAVQPDLFVAPLVAGRSPKSWAEIHTLILAVEILSPRSARAYRHVKRRLYQSQTVPEYWIVDVDARLIERWTPTDERPEMLAATLAWQPDPAFEPLAIDLEAYFGEVCNDRGRSGGSGRHAR